LIKILIVEDDRSIQFLYSQLLTLNRFKVVGIANNGEEAVSLFKSLSNRPEVILMDYRMPMKNGIDASKEILKIDKTVKIIFISADSSIKEEVKSLGVVSFKDKPISNDNLINNIKKAINAPI